MQAAGGIEYHNIFIMLAGVGDGVKTDLNRIVRPGFCGCKTQNIERLAQNFQLFCGGRAVYVGGNEQRTFAALDHILSKLAAECGFTRTLKAHDHDDRRRNARMFDRLIFAAQRCHQFVMDDLDKLFARAYAAQHLLPHGLGRRGVDKIFDDLEMHIRFQ